MEDADESRLHKQTPSVYAIFVLQDDARGKRTPSRVVGASGTGIRIGPCPGVDMQDIRPRMHLVELRGYPQGRYHVPHASLP